MLKTLQLTRARTIGRLEVSVHYIFVMEVAHSSGYANCPRQAQRQVWLASVLPNVTAQRAKLCQLCTVGYAHIIMRDCSFSEN